MKIWCEDLRSGDLYGWAEGACWQARLVVDRRWSMVAVFDLNEARAYEVYSTSFEVDLFVRGSEEEDERSAWFEGRGTSDE